MPNKPRPENRHRMVRVEDDLWEAARVAAEKEGTTRAEVMREALRELVEPTSDETLAQAVGRLADEWEAGEGPTASDDMYADLLRALLAEHPD